MGFLEEKGGVLRILYLGTRNTLNAYEDAGFTKSNTIGNPQILANATTAGIKKLGCLAGSVVAIKANGVVGAAGAASATDKVVGIVVNDAAGNAYESSSAASSGKCVFVCNFGTYETNVYETADVAGGDISTAYHAGDKLYSSANGLLTVVEGLAGGAADPAATVVGIVTVAPTASNPWLQFNLRI